jgi:hypothetical protein
MSYDIWLEIDAGGPKPVRCGSLDVNYTYNVSPMFKEAVGETPGSWDGRRAADIAEVCGRILAAFAAEPNKFIALNPANGWGDFDGARSFIQQINDACHEAPNAIVRSC